jgi:DNA-binding MarR family transcriptional regulator
VGGITRWGWRRPSPEAADAGGPAPESAVSPVREEEDALLAHTRLEHDAHTVERLDRALLGIRKAVTLSDITSMPLPELPGGLDLAKAMACMAIADLVSDEPDRIVTVKDVAQSLALEHSTASRLLADTEAEGLIERGVDPTDRRRTSVRLTDVGQRSVARILATRTWALDALLADWSAEDVDGFADYVERFIATMQQRLDTVIGAAMTRFIESEPEA